MANTNTGQSYRDTSFRRLLSERLAGEGPPIHQALLEVVDAVSHWQPTAPLIYADVPPRLIEIIKPTLAAYVAEVEQARSQGIPKVFRLASDPQISQLALFFDVEPNLVGNIEYVWFSLPTTDTDELLQLTKIIDLVANISSGFDSYHSCVEDESLLLLYRGARGTERARLAVSPEMRNFVPASPVPEKALGSLPQLLAPQEFNRRYVPDAVWWVNFWDKGQVETVGQDRIQKAGWAQIIEQPDEALVLIATEEPVDISNEAHLEQLRRIIDHLKLRELQERYRY